MENKKLHKQILAKYDKSKVYTYITHDLVSEIQEYFMPCDIQKRDCKNNNRRNNCSCRCKRAYWIDHGMVTQSIMKQIARKISKDETLYGFVGYLHDVDYLKYAHDIDKGVDFKHPIPLVSYLNKKNVNPIILLAIIEHAAYIELYKEPTSYLSATLAGAEDLATLMSMENFSEYEEELSSEAKELAKNAIKPMQRINIKHEKPRIIGDIEKYINIPIDIALKQKEVRFDF